MDEDRIKKLEQRDNLLALYFLCDELAWGYNLLVNKLLSTYGCGFRPADSSKGEKGVTFCWENKIDISFDSQVNFLLRSLIFAGKSTVDQIFHTMAVMRNIIQPGSTRCGLPDASRPRNFKKLVKGLKAGIYDNINGAIEAKLHRCLEIFIPLRVMRNNIKEFGRANFQLIMGRPNWEFVLTKENIADETLPYSSIYKGQIHESMTFKINLRFFEFVFWESLEMFEVLLGLVESKADLLDFVTDEQIKQLSERQRHTEGVVTSSNLYPYGHWSPDGVFHMGEE